MLYALSKLDTGDLKAIQRLEKDLDLPLIAMSGVDIATARLDGEKLRKVQELERELGVVLVAVNRN